MTDCTATGNTPGFLGGGIRISGGRTAVLTRCTITANQSTDGTSGDGGGIFVNDGSLTLNSTRVGGPTPAEANHANGGGTPGGGIYRNTGTVMTNSSVVCGNVPDQCGPASFSDPACKPPTC